MIKLITNEWKATCKKGIKHIYLWRETTWVARSFKIKSSPSTLYLYMESFLQWDQTTPNPRLQERGEMLTCGIWGKKARTGIKGREGSSLRNIFQLHLKPKKDGFKYGSLTTACWAIMLNPSYFEYVMELHKKAYCISLSHCLKLILFHNARNKITGKWPRKYTWLNRCILIHFVKGHSKLSWNP